MQVIPSQGDNAALQLMILIDDTLNTQAVGNNLNDLKAFIGAQPPSTVIGVAYMSNAMPNVAQNFTADHALAVKAVRCLVASLPPWIAPTYRSSAW